jgi:hypothetical protein
MAMSVIKSRIAGAIKGWAGEAPIDLAIRQAIRLCCMMLPKDKRNLQHVTEVMEHLLQRGLDDLHKNAREFGLEPAPPASATGADDVGHVAGQPAADFSSAGYAGHDAEGGQGMPAAAGHADAQHASQPAAGGWSPAEPAHDAAEHATHVPMAEVALEPFEEPATPHAATPLPPTHAAPYPPTPHPATQHPAAAYPSPQHPASPPRTVSPVAPAQPQRGTQPRSGSARGPVPPASPQRPRLPGDRTPRRF